MSRGPHVRARVTTATPVRTAVVIAAALAVLAGCGSDTDSTAEDPAGETPSSTTAETDSPTGTPTPSDPTTSPDPSTSPPDAGTLDLPACDAVWVTGQELPGGYEGCLAADGSPVDAGGQYCEFGKPIFSYDGRFYAVSNGPVNQTDGPLAKDRQYRSALRKCGG